MTCLTPIDSVECLVKWLQGLSVLGIFWAKRVREITVVFNDPPVLILDWKHSKRSRKALFTLCYEFNSDCLNRLQSSIRNEHFDLLLVTGSELPWGLYDRWSKIFIYDPNKAFLEPNHEIIIEVYEPDKVNRNVVLAVEAVQMSSWGFYRPPPREDYVLIAKLPGGEPVGSTYYNPSSSNIDYGVHVSRPYWRHRIGTRLLVEVAKLAKTLRHKWVSVVRVIRGTRPVQSDRRAITFYRSNKPIQELNVYRSTISKDQVLS